MNLLAIDTSTERISVAIAVKEAIISEEHDSPREHTRLLLPIIERLLAESGLTLNQLDAIVFGSGPGSFTGLRIACSIAKGLAYAQDLPLVPVSGLVAIVDEARFQQPQLAESAQILALIDARMQQLYWGCYRPGEIRTVERVSAIHEIKTDIDLPLIIAGVGYESYLLQGPGSVLPQEIMQLKIYPSATAMLRLAQSGKLPSVSAAAALPSYVRNQIVQGESGG